MIREIELTANVRDGQLVDPDTGYEITQAPRFFRGDRHNLRIALVRVDSSTNPRTVEEVPPDPGYVYSFGAKRLKQYDASRTLAFATLSIDDGDLVGSLDCDSPDLRDAIGGQEATLPVVFELQAKTAGAPPTTIMQFIGNVRNDVLRGDEGDPQPAGPTYYNAQQIDDLFVPKTGTAVRIDENGIQYLFPDMTWRRLVPLIVDGHATFDFQEVVPE